MNHQRFSQIWSQNLQNEDIRIIQWNNGVTPWPLTRGIGEDVLLTGGPEPRVEGGEDEAIVAGLPGEGSVGDAVHRSAPEPAGRGAQRLRDLLPAHAPVRGRERHQRQQQRQQRLQEGQAWRTQDRQKRHAAEKEPKSVKEGRFSYFYIIKHLKQTHLT